MSINKNFLMKGRKSLKPLMILKKPQNPGRKKNRKILWLLPLKGKASTKKDLVKIKKKPPFYNTGDFESLLYKGEHIVFAIGIYIEKIYKEFILDPITEKEIKNNNYIIKEKSNVMIINMIKYLFNFIKEQQNLVIYFHNLSYFDGVFIVNAVLEIEYTMYQKTKDNIIYEIIISYENKKLSFRDSLHIIPISLDKAARTIKKKKMDWDHTNNKIENLHKKTFRKNMLEYLKNDVLILNSILDNYIKVFEDILNDDIMDCLTIASIAFKYFRIKHYNTTCIAKLHPKTDNRIREGYIGGVCNTYKPTNFGNTKVYGYDINSLYPYIMANCFMPIGPAIKKDKKDIDLKTFFGYVYVHVKTPEVEYLPVLAVKINNVNHQPLGEWTAMYFSADLQLALEMGYKIQPIYGYAFKKKIIFKDYVTTIYNLRTKCKDPLKKTIYKLLLNSLYGKFGMKLWHTLCTIGNSDDVNNIMKFHNIKDINKLKENTYHISYTNEIDMKQLNKNLINNLFSYQEMKDYVKLTEYQQYQTNTAVHIASAITSYARIYMYKYKKKYETSLLYSDTDSLYVTQPIDPEDISPTTLGKFKLENIYDKGYFLAPKFYALFKKDEKPIIKIKGLSEYQKSKQLYTIDWWESKLKKDSPTYTTIIKRNFKRDLPNYRIHYDEKNRKMLINIGLTKREKIYNKDNTWIDTKPIKYKNF